jgi:hypothetical protein
VRFGALWWAALAGCPSDLDPIDSDDDVGALVGILVTPATVVVPLGDEVQLTATGLREDRTTVDLTAVVDWSSTDGAVASVSGDLDAEGRIVGEAVGEAVVRASFDGVLSPDVAVRVTDAELVGLAVEPKTVSVGVGGEVRLRATAGFTDGSRSDASAQVRWITADGSVARVDASGLLVGAAVGETEVHAEWDNARAPAIPVTVVAAAEPDLVVDSVAFEPGPEEVTVTLRVRNDGDVGAADYWVDVFLDPATAPTPGDLGDEYFPMFYTEAGELSEVVFSLDAEPGAHELVVIVDGEGLVPESDESNTTTHAFDVGEEGGTNLVISYFDALVDATSVYYAIDVTNRGTAPIGPFYIDLWFDAASDPTASGVGDRYVRVDGLEPGETRAADFFEEMTCDFCWSWAMVDTNGEVVETVEDDNVAGPIVVDTPAGPRE